MFQPVVCRLGLFIIWEVLFEPPVKKISSSFDKALEVWVPQGERSLTGFSPLNKKSIKVYLSIPIEICIE